MSKERAAKFRSLHAPGQFLTLANAWDAGSARLIENCGAPAIATTSAGVAWACGYADGNALPTKLLLQVVENITRVISVPLSVDSEGGYSDDPKQVAEVLEHVRRKPNTKYLHPFLVTAAYTGANPTALPVFGFVIAESVPSSRPASMRAMLPKNEAPSSSHSRLSHDRISIRSSEVASRIGVSGAVMAIGSGGSGLDGFLRTARSGLCRVRSQHRRSHDCR